MKKIVALLLSLVLICSGVALAEESLDLTAMSTEELNELISQAKKELDKRRYAADAPAPSCDNTILFRGFPWLSSETEMLANLKSMGYTSSTHGEGPGYSEIGSWEINLKENFYTEEPLLTNREIGYWTCVYFSDNAKVAGFDISYVSMNFLYGYDDKRVYRDRDHSRMISATYDFSVADPQMAFDVLLQKMSTLYGEPVMAYADGSSYAVSHAIWYGADNTAVRLDMRIAKGDSNSSYDLQLCYGVSNSLELIADLQNAITMEIINQGSMEGL